MIVTEASARERLCPRLAGVPGYGRCIGSDCMWWRWWEPFVGSLIADRQREGWEYVPPDEDEEHKGYWIEPFNEAQKRRLGCCGAANPGGGAAHA